MKSGNRKEIERGEKGTVGKKRMMKRVHIHRRGSERKIIGTKENYKKEKDEGTRGNLKGRK